MGFVALCKATSIRDGEGKGFSVGGRDLAVFRCGEELHAVSSLCTHALADLSEGSVDRARHRVECPLHGAEFDLRTGEALSPPAALSLQVFAVKVEDGQVLVDLSGKQPG